MSNRLCSACKTTTVNRHSVTGLCKACRKARDVAEDARVLTVETPTDVRSLADLMAVCQIDEVMWHVDRWGCSNVPSKPGKYQVKASLRRKWGGAALAKASIDALVEQAKEKWPVLGPQAGFYLEGDDDLMLEIQIPDAHFGKLAWKEETGEANYDTRIAERLFNNAFETLLARATAQYKFGRIVFPIGSDGLHADTKQGTTTAGTILDTDSRYQRNYLAYQRCVIRAAELASSAARHVDVYAIPGNHDAVSTWTLGNALSLFFRNEPDIVVHNTANHRQYVEHGCNMIMLTHGNQGKLERYPNLMAEDEPEIWGRTTFREAHTGDKHQTKVQEIMGTRIRICPALCPADAWHAEKHFVHQKRAAEAFIWHAKEGLIGTLLYNVKP